MLIRSFAKMDPKTTTVRSVREDLNRFRLSSNRFEPTEPNTSTQATRDVLHRPQMRLVRRLPFPFNFCHLLEKVPSILVRRVVSRLRKEISKSQSKPFNSEYRSRSMELSANGPRNARLSLHTPAPSEQRCTTCYNFR